MNNKFIIAFVSSMSPDNRYISRWYYLLYFKIGLKNDSYLSAVLNILNTYKET